MKNFKQILNEFRGIDRNDGGRPEGDPHERIAQFMERTPFTHMTTEGDEIHFHNSLRAAKVIAHQRENHEDGVKYSAKVGDRPMTEYFLSAAGTHDDAFDAVEDHIFNHPKLPSDLKPHLEDFFTKLEEIAASKRRSTNYMNRVVNPQAHENEIGKVMHKLLSPKPTDPPSRRPGEHPHMYNERHHLDGVIKTLRDNPDDGYFLPKEEK